MDIKVYFDPGLVGHKEHDGLLIDGKLYSVEASYADKHGICWPATRDALEYIAKALECYKKSSMEGEQESFQL